jgi:hypothetical protein
LALRLGRLVALGRAKAFSLEKWETFSTVRQARRLCQAKPAEVRICWDLDNTLADSGSLLKSGLPLREAIKLARPVPNMIAFVEALKAALPDAEHLILTARRNEMRMDTVEWLDRHGLRHSDAAVCLVPTPEAKRRVWKRLSMKSQLVIVDDLRYGHESRQPSSHIGLVDFARRTASVYVGSDEIARIIANPRAAGEIAAWTIKNLELGDDRDRRAS